MVNGEQPEFCEVCIWPAFGHPSSHIPLLQVEKPFDTPAARATQGERTLTRLVSFKKSVRAEPVEA